MQQYMHQKIWITLSTLKALYIYALIEMYTCEGSDGYIPINIHHFNKPLAVYM
jgi:hypothetical protein